MESPTYNFTRKTIDIEEHRRIVGMKQDEIESLKKQMTVLSLTMDNMQQSLRECYDAIEDNRVPLEILIQTARDRDMKIKELTKQMGMEED